MSNVNDESHDAKNITIILDALKGATNEEDRRMYSRAVARHLEHALVGAAAVASLFVEALTVRP
jgi:hypothetical protein